MKKSMSHKQGKMHPQKHTLESLFDRAMKMQPAKNNNYPSKANSAKNAVPMKSRFVPTSAWAEALKNKPASALKTC